MKKIVSYLLCISVIFSSCKKDNDNAFSTSPDQRLNEAISNYQNKLIGAANGWKAFIQPAAGGTFFFYMKFDNQNRVKMYSTFDSASAITPMESSYRLKALQQPSLLFDTYSYVHILADPNENVVVKANVNGGPVGAGLRSDFEFTFDNSDSDTIKLTGSLHGSKAYLIPATKQEADAIENKQLANSLLFQNLGKYLNYFKRLTIAGNTYEINLNQDKRTITLSWVNSSGAIQTFTTFFYYTLSGLQFVTPFTNGSLNITGFTNIAWSAATSVVSMDINGTRTSIIGSGQPLKTDLDAPRRWWQYSVTNGDGWTSAKGFHVNGVDDAYNFGAVPGFQYLYYEAQYGTSGGVNYDLLAPIVNNTLAYGSAFRPPAFTADGRVIFTLLGTLGTVPGNAAASLTNTRLQMVQAQGFYLVQTGPLSYDMVSALDGRAWISWEW